MAKKSQIARQRKRERMVEKYAEQRRQLLESGDRLALSRLPRNANPTRLKNRCRLTGRSRSYIRRFGLSRIAFREEALRGNIPGVVKSSW
ncbi:30S ribosomal protein S14 [Chloroflexi bacterium TSY]|nr:30S ribosomal protein S14 [Chloroflexi bacterium TSY]